MIPLPIFNRLTLLIGACAVVPFLVSPNLLADELQAGAAKIDITPPLGGPMWGYAARHDAPSVGIGARLMARAVVMRVGAERLAIVSLDLGRAPTRESFQRIRQKLGEKTGIKHLLLVASHTHHGPVLELDNWPKDKKPYVQVLVEKIVDVINRANHNLQPACFGIASKNMALNRNRHTRRQQKPVDSELIVMSLENARGKPLAHLVNFAAHPTMMPAKTRTFSPDYPGFMAKHVETATKVPCLFLQGAAGDLSPNPGKTKGPVEFGQRLGAEVLQLAKTIRCADLKKTSLKIRERQFRFETRFDLSNPIIKTAFSMAFFPELVNFYEREYRNGSRPVMTTAVLDGRIGFVGVSGEFFCSHALRLKQRANLEHLLFLGYCNDYHQYFPTIEAVAEGGYGAGPQVSPVAVGAGEKMMNQALIDLFQMRGKIPKLKTAK